MSSRPISQNPKPSSSILKSKILFLAITVSATALIIITLIYILYHFWHSLFQRSRTSPFDEITPLKLHKFSYKELKSATNDFNPENAIGKGGTGSVFRGILKDGKSVAVKKLDPAESLQVEREFQNELNILGGIRSPHIVSLLGYCVHKSKRILVYEYMPNRSLQDLLFSEGNLGMGVVSWDRRFQIIQDVSRALEFLHSECDPSVIHGDVKPSNVLLDWDFRAKVSDFGLSRLKVEGGDNFGVDMFSQDLGKSQELLWKSQELSGNMSVETPVSGSRTPVVQQESNRGPVDFALALQASSCSKNGRLSRDLHSLSLVSSASCNVNVVKESDSKSIPSPKGKEALRIGVLEDDNYGSVEHSKEGLDLSPSQNVGGKSKQWGKDWWWKQDGSGELCSKDYVMEWIGSQICPKVSDAWDVEKATLACEANLDKASTHPDALQDGVEGQAQEFEFGNLQHHLNHGIKENSHGKAGKLHGKQEPKKMEDWWKEENLEEMSSKKGSKSQSLASRLRKRSYKPLHFHLGRCFHIVRRRNCREMNAGTDHQEAEVSFRRGWRKKKRTPSMNSEMWSGDLFSRELSSTTSMRGTLCYVAPEYGGGGFLMEKTDIYSLGVLILVIVSGRRPLHVLNSPMKLEKANLISWCRQLAQAGNVLELVDEKLKGVYKKEQATLCINLALACLQRMPELRPDIGDIVRILRGEMDLPPLPFEFSPSPPCKSSRLRSKLQKTYAE